MKTQLTSVDLRFLTREFAESISGARIDKAYQLGEKELKVRFHAVNRGSMDLVLAPGYAALTRFERKAPEQPSHFAMQLRKNLKGAYVTAVRQRGFDRIVEIDIQGVDKRYMLVAEFFSSGNVIYCDSEKKILGLLEWQRWKDRKLGVRQTYEYPPESANPMDIGADYLKKILAVSDKKTVSVLARDAGLGGVYAEEVCLLSGIDKDKPAKSLTSKEIDSVVKSFKEIVEKINNGQTHASIVYLEGKPVDVIPFDLAIYEKHEKKPFPCFNDAVDEFFSGQEHDSAKKGKEDLYAKELGKIKEIESKQSELIARFEKESVECRKEGDSVYQNLHAIETLLATVREEKKSGLSWDEVGKKLKGKELMGVTIVSVDNNGHVTVKTTE